jgi:hypothetical protein
MLWSLVLFIMDDRQYLTPDPCGREYLEITLGKDDLSLLVAASTQTVNVTRPAVRLLGKPVWLDYHV